MAEVAEPKLLARSPATRLLALFALIAVAYALGAELSWQSFDSGTAFGFPPAGITVAAMLLTSRRYWPAVIAAIVVSEVGVDLQHGLTLSAALAAAAANVVEPVVGASLVRRWCAWGARPDHAGRPAAFPWWRRGDRPDRRRSGRGDGHRGQVGRLVAGAGAAMVGRRRDRGAGHRGADTAVGPPARVRVVQVARADLAGGGHHWPVHRGVPLRRAVIPAVPPAGGVGRVPAQ